MEYALEHFGVAVAAITGVLAGRGKRVDLFGVLVLAVVTAFGGGSIRDLCLGSTPVFWIEDPWFVLNAVAAGLATFFLARVHPLSGTTLQVADAFALALFTMVGARKGLFLGTSSTIAVAMGVITGVAGGMIRDVLTGEIPLVFRQQIYLYATASLIGAVAFVLLNLWRPDYHMNLVIGTVITLALRLGAIRWKVTLPEFDPASPPQDSSPPGKA